MTDYELWINCLESDLKLLGSMSAQHIWEYAEFYGIPVVDIESIEYEDFQLVEETYNVA